jgi:hypothetical protein
MGMNASLLPFDELVVKLRAHGFTESADCVSMLMRSGWTSASEFVGELGQAVLKFRREHDTIAPDLRDVLDRCMIEVRIIWPDIR